MGKLDNQIAIVTGAGQGISQSIAHKLSAEGVTVIVTDLNEPTARATAAAIVGGAISMQPMSP
jgi:2-hydroxycyclohexanecarboxyl-CoA dehydrogenase